MRRASFLLKPRRMRVIICMMRCPPGFWSVRCARRRKSFYFRDVFSRRITLASVDGTFPSKGDYQFEVTASMFTEILDMVNRQLEDNFLSEHKASFERQLCMALWPLRDYCAQWAKLDDCEDNN